MKKLVTILPVRFFLFISILLSFQISISQSLRWYQYYGPTAQDISVGKNGTVWATGTNGAIYRWNNSFWEVMPGGASRIAVDGNGAAWVVNDQGHIYKYNLSTRSWNIMPGGASDIAIGGDGIPWIVGREATRGGYLIYKWNGSNWTNIAGGAVRITADPSGKAWIINNTDNIFQYNGTDWVLKPGTAKHIEIGAAGDIWSIGQDGRKYRFDGNQWQLQPDLTIGFNATQIAVAPDGKLWALSDGGGIFSTILRPLMKTSLTLVHRGAYRAFVYVYHFVNDKEFLMYSNDLWLADKTANITVYGPYVRIIVQVETGLVWEPRKTIYNGMTLVYPNGCLKIYGTSLDPRWVYECN